MTTCFLLSYSTAVTVLLIVGQIPARPGDQLLMGLLGGAASLGIALAGLLARRATVGDTHL